MADSGNSGLTQGLGYKREGGGWLSTSSSEKVNKHGGFKVDPGAGILRLYKLSEHLPAGCI